jgi:hypothetical protein
MRRIKPGAFGRLLWAIRTRRQPRSSAGYLRLVWHDFVTHGLFDAGGERCQDCGRDYVLWSAPTALYAMVHGSTRGPLCPWCFDLQARAMGIRIKFIAASLEGRTPSSPQGSEAVTETAAT